MKGLLSQACVGRSKGTTQVVKHAGLVAVAMRKPRPEEHADRPDRSLGTERAQQTAVAAGRKAAGGTASHPTVPSLWQTQWEARGKELTSKGALLEQGLVDLETKGNQPAPNREALSVGFAHSHLQGRQHVSDTF